MPRFVPIYRPFNPNSLITPECLSFLTSPRELSHSLLPIRPPVFIVKEPITDTPPVFYLRAGRRLISSAVIFLAYPNIFCKRNLASASVRARPALESALGRYQFYPFKIGLSTFAITSTSRYYGRRDADFLKRSRTLLSPPSFFLSRTVCFRKLNFLTIPLFRSVYQIDRHRRVA